MTAGSVGVPTIIPLRPPMPGLHKTAIDSTIKIELRTETKDAKIYYTTNGSKPDPFQKFGDKCTLLYREPFTLPAGKQTVKAVALTRDGERESLVVTKTFEVEYVPPPVIEHLVDGGGERSQVPMETKTKTELLRSSNSAWTDVAATKQMQQSLADGSFPANSRRKAPVGARFSEGRRTGTNTRHAQIQLSNGNIVHDIRLSDERDLPEEYTTEAIQALQNMTLNSKRDFLNFTTTNGGQYPNANQWMPSTFPPQNPLMASTTSMGGNLDIPLSMLNGMSPTRRPDTKSTASQTAGLFFPSQRKIDQMEKELEDKVTFEKQMRDRRPLLTAVSPGKGYWRRQVDHICQHLKAHAQNDAEFRALIGDPKMGRLLTSSVQEDGYELSLTLTFALRENKDPFVDRKLGISTHKGYLSQHTERDSVVSGSEDEVMSEDNVTARSTTSASGRKRSARRAKQKKKQAPKPSPLDVKLLRQLGSEGTGSSTEVQKLIDEGANPSSESKSGVPALHLAARNKHIDCIAVLVQSGADVNAKGPASVKGNTALHEAVSLGVSGAECVDALLDCGADHTVKNDKGETAYDLASKAGYENLVKKFAAALGQSQLQKMIRSRNMAE
ncbi:double zinc ribbon and ankyrin repeat-containing protein 1-like [Babylonia areolata]|uniref:double zinc ribbon and ankyrin repeat-containing protein 1-like n=1 Tax=Babylonia areolata TaxID=304850 RepID=UPI003FD1FC2B